MYNAFRIIYDGNKEAFVDYDCNYTGLNEFAVCKLCGQYQRINKVEVVRMNKDCSYHVIKEG